MKAAILLPVLAGADAVGNDARAMVQLLIDRGIDARLFCDVAVGVADATYPASELLEFAGGHDDLVIYHFSVGWPPGLDILRRARGFRVVRYHNITPPEFFTEFSVDHAAACADGRAEIPALARLGCELYMCDSAYNAGELVSAGADADSTVVIAPFHRIAQLLEAPVDMTLLSELDDGTHNVLMVGRIAPNKGHVELVDAFARFVDGYGDPARLIIVGKSDPRLNAYSERIRARADAHQLGHRIWWLDSLNESQIKTAYLASHAFMILSRHEGFCVPLIEAMALGVPIVAHASSAIPGTLGGGGIAWEEADPWLYASSLQRLRADDGFRNDLRDRAHRRFQREFAHDVLRDRFFAALEPAL
ncbi:MAG: glycosyltransferase [Dokdonella sp.]|uniref:glycosyltransferase n=1 Tax=Dokdonella sp. TaxID=2291710 RepID=UPI0032632328